MLRSSHWIALLNQVYFPLFVPLLDTFFSGYCFVNIRVSFIINQTMNIIFFCKSFSQSFLVLVYSLHKITGNARCTGLTVTADIIYNTYETGKKVAKDFMQNLKIKFDDSVPKLNYTIYPMSVVWALDYFDAWLPACAGMTNVFCHV